MERKNFLIKTICAIFLMVMFSFGCDIFQKEEIPPEKLPPVPEVCNTLLNQYTHALTVAYSSAEASQLQVTRVASQFDKCMQDAGLSEAESKGILRNIEKTVREKIEKGGGQQEYFYR